MHASRAVADVPDGFRDWGLLSGTLLSDVCVAVDCATDGHV